MTENDFMNLINSWDYLQNSQNWQYGEPSDPDEHRRRKTNEEPHKSLYKDLKLLADHFYCDYEQNGATPFETILCNWIDQFDDITLCNLDVMTELALEKRYAFLLSSKVLFFSRDHLRSLINKVWNDVKRILFITECKTRNLSIIENLQNNCLMDYALSHSLFTPLSDSSRFMEFRQSMPPGSHSNLTLDHIDILTNPIKSDNQDLISQFKSKYAQKESLFIVEDFSGSGTTIGDKVKQIIANYNFSKIYFCPYIISNQSLDYLESIKAIAHDNDIEFNIVSGIELGDEYSICSSLDDIWKHDEKEALRIMCKKYFKSHFYTNGYLYDDFQVSKPIKSTPYGFKDCGLAVVLHSNCPNNSLPLIWETSSGWRHLFKRHERHEKVVYNDAE